MVEVAILVATFRRPRGLERLLHALAALRTDATVRVIVADNDGDSHEGHTLCERLRQQNYRWPLDSFIVPERGIAQARNALFARALGGSAQFFAMLDDDEWPESCWLAAFLDAQRQAQADALQGAVRRVFEKTPPVWLTRCAGLDRLDRPSGPIATIDSSCNVLLARRCLENLRQPFFDCAFALTGGEDRDFFTRLGRTGARFAWARQARVHAFVPASRATLGWVLRRAYRVGNSDMRVFLKYRPAPRACGRELAKIAAASLLFPLALIIFCGIANRRAWALCKLWRAAGKIAALFGRHYNEYAVIHGG